MMMRHSRPTRFKTILALVVLGSVLIAGSDRPAAQKASAETATVFAAASLKNALDEACKAFAEASGGKVTASYAASSALAKQIEQGAPADLFISADLEWMDYLASKGHIAAGTRVNLLGNRLVLVAPAASAASIRIEPGFRLADALGGGRLAVGDVKAVPAGKYAKAALESLGVWASVEDKLAPAENVRAALALVAQGEAPLGIVYATDAAAEPKVRIVDTFPESSHPPVVYPAAVTTAAASPEASKSLLAFLRSNQAHMIFAKHGFSILP